MEKNHTDYRELAEFLPQSPFQIDRRGFLSFANRTGCQAFGYEPADLQEPRDALEFFAPEDRPRLARKIKSISAGETEAGGGYNGLRKNGVTFPVLVFAGAVVENGRPAGIRGVIIDISGMLNSRKLLEKSEQRFRQLLETMNEGFAIVDADTVLTYVNPRLCRMLGYEAGEMVGQKVQVFLNPQNRQVLRKNYIKRRRGRSDSYELAWTQKNGDQLATIMAPAPLYNDDGGFAGSYSVITNVTLLKLTEAALRQRERELESKTLNLEEANAALKVLLKRRDEDRRELEERIMANVRELVTPYLAKLKRTNLGERQQVYLEILENNLKELTAPFVDSLSRSFQKLTPAEIRVAALVREGKTSKQIADILALSPRTVEFHRDRIRRKLGLSGSKANLRSFLLSLR